VGGFNNDVHSRSIGSFPYRSEDASHEEPEGHTTEQDILMCSDSDLDCYALWWSESDKFLRSVLPEQWVRSKRAKGRVGQTVVHPLSLVLIIRPGGKPNSSYQTSILPLKVTHDGPIIGTNPFDAYHPISWLKKRRLPINLCSSYYFGSSNQIADPVSSKLYTSSCKPPCSMIVCWTKANHLGIIFRSWHITRWQLDIRENHVFSSSRRVWSCWSS